MRPGPVWSLLVAAGVAFGVISRLETPLALALAIGAVSLAAAPLPRRVLDALLAAALLSASAAYGAGARDAALSSPLAAWVAARAAAAGDPRSAGPVTIHGRLERDAGRHEQRPDGTGTHGRCSVQEPGTRELPAFRRIRRESTQNLRSRRLGGWRFLRSDPCPQFGLFCGKGL